VIKTNDLIKAAKPIGLEVNQNKTKYLVMTRGTRKLGPCSRKLYLSTRGKFKISWSKHKSIQ